jgi:hypothetical protein
MYYTYSPGDPAPIKRKLMSKLKSQLLAQKKEIEEKLKPYYELLGELEEVNKALKALEPPTCSEYCSGCDICRRGLLV